jgi:hypothetical protein
MPPGSKVLKIFLCNGPWIASDTIATSTYATRDARTLHVVQKKENYSLLSKTIIILIELIKHRTALAHEFPMFFI